MHEGLWVNFVERVPLEVELQQLGTLLEETGARDARDPVLAQEPVWKNWIRTINFSAIRMKLRVAPRLSSSPSFSDKPNPPNATVLRSLASPTLGWHAAAAALTVCAALAAIRWRPESSPVGSQTSPL